LLDERYDARPLEQTLATYMGDAMISQAVTDVMVTSYDLEHRKPFFFKTDRAKDVPEHDWLMRAAARATSAAAATSAATWAAFPTSVWIST
jgi:patatin-like phospholipase/acyl hydrolase